MKLSVAICTRNRSTSLRRTLESIANTRIPPELQWEVLVVNNNSTDDTDLVIDNFSDRLPVRRLFESARGLSNARNTAVTAARGEYIIWTDDDVVVTSSWLDAYCRAIDQWRNAVLFGGPIRPHFAEPVPRWLQQGWSAVPAAFAAVDLGEEPVIFSVLEGKIPYGANFGIRRTEQLKHPYNLLLGAGTNYYAEETTVIIEILKGGAEGRWVPAAAVDHIISTERMSVGYLSQYYERLGRTLYYLDHRTAGDNEARLFGRPRWIWRSIAEGELKYWASRLFEPSIRWLPALRARAVAWGAFKESGRRRALEGVQRDNSTP